MRLFALATALLIAGLAAPSHAEGLRIGVGFVPMHYETAGGVPTNVYYTSVSARVSRGRAGMSFGVPVIGISGGSIANSGDHPTVTDDGIDPSDTEAVNRIRGPEFGDMSVGIDYNLIQNREKMFVVTLGGSMRFPTGPSNKGLGAGETVFGPSLSGAYWLTRQLCLYAELRQSMNGVYVPLATVSRTAEVGAVYWLSDKLGLNVSGLASRYRDKATSFETNAGLMVEALPGMMVNIGGLGGFGTPGTAPQFGGNLGFSFEL